MEDQEAEAGPEGPEAPRLPQEEAAPCPPLLAARTRLEEEVSVADLPAGLLAGLLVGAMEAATVEVEAQAEVAV